MKSLFLQSHLLLGEFSICALCCSYSQSLRFSFLVPPGTHYCWVDWGVMIWEACPTPLHVACQQRDSSNGHPSKCKPGSELLNFSDLGGTGYHYAMCRQNGMKLMRMCNTSDWLNPLQKLRSDFKAHFNFMKTFYVIQCSCVIEHQILWIFFCFQPKDNESVVQFASPVYYPPIGCFCRCFTCHRHTHFWYVMISFKSAQ